MEVFVARQAIFDRNRKVRAYELLYRSDADAQGFDGTGADTATRQVIAGTLLSIGFDKLLGGKQAFINFDDRLLADGTYLTLPRESTVIEILEHVDPTDDLIALCHSIREQGYALALDDFVADPKVDPLTHIAQVIKVDFRLTPRPEQQRMLDLYRRRGITMLAEKVETQEEFEWARNAGYELFQGYFFAKPVIVRGRRIQSSQSACLGLLQEIRKPEPDFRKLEALVQQDVSLSYQLLRYVNSAIFANRERIGSIARALMYLGLEGVRRWVLIAALPHLGSNKPDELISLSLSRAGFCEHIARLLPAAKAQRGLENEAFLAGMFSLLDALMDQPMADALEEMKLSAPLQEALLGEAHGPNLLATLLELIRRYEIGDWDRIQQLCHGLNIPPGEVRDAYIQSAVWAQQLLTGPP
jgi:EAL and modified HD-GYP domain-containing signal transduction protein